MRFTNLDNWPTALAVGAGGCGPDILFITSIISLLSSSLQGWSGGAMMVGKLPVPGRPTNLDNGRVRRLQEAQVGMIWTFFILPSKTGRIISCTPSVCSSVNFSCPLHNSNTVQDIFMELGTNINHHQTMCRDQEPTLHLHVLRSYGTVKLL